MISDAEVDDFFCRSVAALDAWLTPERLREINASTEKRKNPFDLPESRCFETNGWPIDETGSSAETVGDSASVVAASGKVRPSLKGSVNKVASGLESNEVTAPAGPSVQYRKAAATSIGTKVAVDSVAVKATGADDDVEIDSFEDYFFGMFSDASCIPVPAYQLNRDPPDTSSSSPEVDLSSVSPDPHRPSPTELRIVESDDEECVQATIDASRHKSPRFRVKWLTRCRDCFHRRKSSSARSTRMTSASSSSSAARRAAPPSCASGGQAMSPSFSSSSSVCRLESTTDQPILRSSEGGPGGVSFSLPLEKRNNNCRCPSASGFYSTDSVSRQCSPLRSILKRSSWRSSVDGMPHPPSYHPHPPPPPLLPPPPPLPSAEASRENGRLSLVANLKKYKVGKTSKPLRADHGLDPWTLGFPITWSFICNPDFSIIDMHLS